MVDSFLLYCIIVNMRGSRGVSLNESEKEFWNLNESYSIIYSRDQLSRISGINNITTKRLFEWLWQEVGIQPGEYLIKRHNDSYRFNPDIEIRFSQEAFAYWKPQGLGVDK